MDLYESLQAYAKESKIPMHMPGHKRNPGFEMDNPYSWDVTEVEGTDNLYHPQGIIKKELDRLRELYKTQDSYMLVNGSTGGILTAIAACCRRGDHILVGRNCHRAVYNAIYLLELNPVYLFPKEDRETGILLEIPARKVEEVLQRVQVSCVVLTSPTYEGIVSDIASIADICHEKGVPLIVDEAHGAHFAWGDFFAPPAMEQGADLVIESLHKTLPCLTQTAVLHRCTQRVSRERLQQYMGIFQTSSPSYVLMGSISRCITWLEEKGRSVWETYKNNLEAFEKEAVKWKHLRLWRHEKQDCSKLVIGTWGTSISGVELGQCLREKYHIETEMESSQYVLAMTSVADEAADLQRLAWAVSQIDQEVEMSREKNGTIPQQLPLVRKMPYQADFCEHETVTLEESVGRITAEYAYIYPPGIPFLVPGEEITEEVCEQMRQAKGQGLTLLGLKDEQAETIQVCC